MRPVVVFAIALIVASLAPRRVFAVEMELSGRRQANTQNLRFPLDFYDSAVRSPKSVKFSESGEFVYVNALEGMKTLIYNRFGTQKIGEIVHAFDQSSEALFENTPNFGYQLPASKKFSDRFNIFGGKPVEMEISHQGKYLWLPYYRRDFDANGSLPSAVAIVNTQTKKIERVMSAGPIPKNIRLSHRGDLMAVTHWGDNTIGLFDVRSSKAKDFRALDLLVDEKKLSVDLLGTVNRDEVCGYCVRGLAFSMDDRFLFVGRMAEDGISVFDVSSPSQARYIGTVHGIGRRPRDLEVTDDSLIVSFNGSGEIAQIPINWLMTEILQGVTYLPVDKIKKVYVGEGLRSIEVTEDGAYVFVAVNTSSEVVAVNLKQGRVEKRLSVDSYPVGLGLSPDEHQLWVTAQGHSGVGGNSVMVIQLRRPETERVHQ
jgi:DNA-binding beta-propeller fold protein YncE